LALAVSVLRDRSASFVFVRDGRVLAVGEGSGIAPLVHALDRFKPAGLEGASLADKIIGRAAALIAVYGGVRAVHGEFMSRAAMDELARHGITFTYGVEIPSVLNQRGTHLCPFEELVAGAPSPAAAVQRLRTAVQEGIAKASLHYIGMMPPGWSPIKQEAATQEAGPLTAAAAPAARPGPDGAPKGKGRLVAQGGMGLAAALVLPVAFHAVGIGPAFLPMHVPVLVAGALTTPFIGALVGLLAPLLSHVLTGMPPLVPPIAPLMAFELAAYGAAAGWLRPLVMRGNASAVREYMWLLPAMVIGRLALAAAAAVPGSFLGLPVPAWVYVQGATAAGVPGIVLQLLLIPVLVQRLSWGGSSL